MCFGEVGHKTEKKEVSEGIPYFRKKQNYILSLNGRIPVMEPAMCAKSMSPWNCRLVFVKSLNDTTPCLCDTMIISIIANVLACRLMEGNGDESTHSSV